MEYLGIDERRLSRAAMLSQQYNALMMMPLGELNNGHAQYPAQMQFTADFNTFDATQTSENFFSDPATDSLWSFPATTNFADDWGASVDWTQLPNFHQIPELDTSEQHFVPTEPASPITDMSEEIFASISRKSTSSSSSSSTTSSSLQRSESGDIRCWEHGCNGRTFSSLSNYRRHRKEKSKTHPRAICPRCGRRFSRAAARDVHYNQRRCKLTCLDHNRMPFQISMN